MNLRYALLVAVALFAAAAALLGAAGSTSDVAFVAGGTIGVVATCLLGLTLLAARWRAVDVRFTRALDHAHDAASLYDDLLADTFDDDAGDLAGDSATG